MSSPTGDNEDDSFLDAITNGEFEFVGSVVVPAKGHGRTTETQATANASLDTGNGNGNGNGNANGNGGILGPNKGVVDASSSIRNEIYRADGEIKILRAQLDDVRSSKDKEISRLRDLVELLKQDHSSQVVGLKGMVDKLEDEKKFLNNELKSVFLTSKKRKVTESQAIDTGYMPRAVVGGIVSKPQLAVVNLSPTQTSTSTSTTNGPVFSVRRNKKLNEQAWLLIDELSASSINGALRTNIEFLLKIYIDPGFTSDIDTFEVGLNTPLANCIVKYLMNNKEIRLDLLVDSFCRNMVHLITHLILRSHTVSLPFLLSLIHTCIGFRPNAVGQDLILHLTEQLIGTLKGHLNLLEDGEASQIGYFDVPDQQLMFKKLYIVCAMDTVEKLAVLASSKELSVWHLIPADLLRQCLPENSNTFVSLAQINLVYNMVIMLQSSAGPNSFAYESATSKDQNSTANGSSSGVSSKELINSLLKSFLIDIGIRQEFVFYGLNRVLGNNCDLPYIEQAIPIGTNILGQSMVTNPDPIRRGKWQLTPLVQLRHEDHLLNLRILISNLLEYYVTVNPTMFMNDLNYEEVVKAIIRVIGYEQNNIISCPRDRYIHLRLKIIASLVVVLYHMVYHKRTDDIIYPETMYEIFVVLTRISFSNESLLVEASAFLQRARLLLVTIPIFNRWCEQRARELNHIDVTSPMVMSQRDEPPQGEAGDPKLTAEVESEFANGIEFPYDTQTVELARDVLNSFVDTVEADNLYYNMNYEDEARDMAMDLDEDVPQESF